MKANRAFICFFNRNLQYFKTEFFLSLLLIALLTGCDNKDVDVNKPVDKDLLTDTIYTTEIPTKFRPESRLLDSDLDGVVDILDVFPNDSRYVADNNSNLVPNIIDGIDETASRNEKDVLLSFSQFVNKFVHFHTGEGEFALNPMSYYYPRYQDILVKAQDKYEASLVAADSKPAISNKGYVELVERFYFLALGYQSTKRDEYRSALVKTYNLLLNIFFKDESNISFVDNWRNSVLGNALILARPALTEAGFSDSLLSLLWSENNDMIEPARLLANAYLPFVESRLNIGQNVDFFRAELSLLIASVAVLPEQTYSQKRLKVSRIIQLRELLRRYLSISPGRAGVYKPDCSGFHHGTNYVSGYVPQGTYALAKIIYLFKGTDFEFQSNELNSINCYIENVMFYSALNYVPKSLSGRLYSSSIDKSMSLTTAKAIPLLLSNLSTESIKVFWFNINNSVETSFGYYPTYRVSQSGFPGELKAWQDAQSLVNSQVKKDQHVVGVRNYPYSAHLSVREKDWFAVIKGFNKWQWTYEGGIGATNPQNLYGIYFSHGSFDLNYVNKQNKTLTHPRHQEGYDWSHVPGTTAPYRTNSEIVADEIASRQTIDKTATGGVTLTSNGQSYGAYMFDLSGVGPKLKDTSFSAKKSYFYTGEYFIHLGSNILNTDTTINNEHRDYPIHTTLFQNYLSLPQYNDSLLQVNDSAVLNSEEASFRQGRKNNTLIDSNGTGYVIFSVNNDTSNTLTVLKDQNESLHQNSTIIPPTRAYRESAWIDHGASPTNSHYGYLTVPNTTPNNLRRLGAELKNEIEIINVDEKSHVVHILKKNLWAYALFENFQPSVEQGPLASISIDNVIPSERVDNITAHEGYLAIVEQVNSNEMNLALSYPDLRLHETFTADIPSISRDEYYIYKSAPVILEVRLHGSWQLSNIVPNQQTIQSSINNDVTTFLLTLNDGKGIQLNLSRK